MSSSAHNATPRLAGFDHTMALLREGYDFVSRRCDALGSDQFQTRLMLRPVVCLRGSDAAEMFYDGDRFTRRRGAMPPTVLRLLQDKGSVQQLDGAEHRHRKAMFVGLLMDPEAQAGFTECFKAEWHSALDDWAQRSSIVLFDEVNLILTRAVFRWTGVPLDPPAAPQMAVSLSMMIERAGKIGPSLVEALWRRRVVERYVADVIAAVRGGTMNVDPTSPLAIIANHRDANGQLLDIPSATVEVINLLRPTVAVGRFIMFAAMALEDHPEWKTALKGAGDVEYERFAEEVRRLYPFFPFIGGTARVDFYWEGHSFAKGDWVLLDLHGTNHDPRFFPGPYDFRPDRGLTWRDEGHAFVPQGAGNPRLGHRCPGEGITVGAIREATRLLVEEMSYEVPPQDFSMPLNRIPARPKSGMVFGHPRRANP